MRLTIESTDQITHLDGVASRVWRGTTPEGLPCTLTVRDLAFDASPGVACDCGHPVSYHRDRHGAEAPTACGWCPPHSAMRCACAAPTTTGVPRDERYSKDTHPRSGT